MLELEEYVSIGEEAYYSGFLVGLVEGHLEVGMMVKKDADTEQLHSCLKDIIRIIESHPGMDTKRLANYYVSETEYYPF